jgi:hypothetical protein
MSEVEGAVKYARRLIDVPILHSPADMGTMAEGLEAALVERFGRRHWDEYVALLDGFWRVVRAELDELGLDYHLVDLYQDGLPVCGRELAIAAKAAAKGSENHQLLLDLVARGATLMGTEDPNLLLEEYRNVKSALPGDLGGARPAEQAADPSRHDETLAKRDAFIGRRIGESLRPGRTGILFLGMMHNVEPSLPADIVVTRFVTSVLPRRDKPVWRKPSRP